jgi:hypothetical protein
VEELSQAHWVVSDLEVQAEATLKEMREAIRAEVSLETWANVSRLIEALRGLALQSAMVALSQGLKEGAAALLERVGPPDAEASPDIPTEPELRLALEQARLDRRILSLRRTYGLEPVEVVYAQAVGSAIESRYEEQDQALLSQLVDAGTGSRNDPKNRATVDIAFDQLADLSSKKAAEMIVAAYAEGRRKGGRIEFERIRRAVDEETWGY